MAVVAVRSSAKLQSLAALEELTKEILTQMKIQNAHLAEVTGDVRDESDIPAEVK